MTCSTPCLTWPASDLGCGTHTQKRAGVCWTPQSLCRVLICPENCLSQAYALSGTAQVRNIKYEKKVMAHVTFNGWKSFWDTSCWYMQSSYGSTDTDTFSAACLAQATHLLQGCSSASPSRRPTGIATMGGTA